MKKSLLFTVAAIAALGCCFTSCDPEVTEELEPIPQAVPTDDSTQNEPASPTDDSTQKEEKFFKVKFESEHGTVPDEISVKENTSLTEEDLPYLTADYYDFLGWYDGETKVEEGYIVKSSVTLSAKWKKTETPLVLWNGTTEEIKLCSTESGSVYSEYSRGYQEGLKLFNYKDLKNSLEINEPPFSYNALFCFGDESVFIAENGKIAGYKMDDTEFSEYCSIDVKSLYNEAAEKNGGEEYLEIRITSICYIDQYLYFTFGDYDNTEYLGRLKLDTKEDVFSYTPFYIDYESINAIGMYKNDSNLSFIYIGDYNYEYYECIKVPVNNDDFSLDTDNSVVLYKTSSLIEDETRRILNDLQIIDDTCYLLVSQYCILPDFSYFIVLDEENGLIKPIYNSNGGVVKINLKTNQVEKWKDGSEVFGEYKISGPIYSYDDREITDIETLSTLPPIKQADKYFYGPIKFVARKPDALVIADDGSFVDREDNLFDYTGSIKDFKNINRVVTLNLKSELMSSVDVNTSFDSTIPTGSGGF